MTTLILIQYSSCALVALFYCVKKATHWWQYALTVAAFFFPPTIHILAQWRKIPAPSLSSWIVRIVVGVSAAIVCIIFGKLDLLDTQATREFKAQAMMLFSEHTMAVEGISIHLPDRLTIEIPSFGRTAFGVAAVALLYGIVFFRRPYEMMCVLVAIGLLAGIFLDFWITGSTIDTFVETGNLDELAHGFAYSTGVVSIIAAIHWLTFALAAWLGYSAS